MAFRKKANGNEQMKSFSPPFFPCFVKKTKRMACSGGYGGRQCFKKQKNIQKSASESSTEKYDNAEEKNELKIKYKI